MTGRPVVVFLVNGDASGTMGTRANAFAERLSNDFEIHIAYRAPNKIYAIWRFFQVLLKIHPEVCYVFDMSFSGVLAAGIYRSLSRCRVVTDTGDAIYELARASGRGTIGLWLTKLLERFAFAVSDSVVVRSHRHQELLAAKGTASTVIPDGVDTRQFFWRSEDELRRKYDLSGFTVVGLLGSLIWNSRSRTCYGMELIEAIGRVRDLPVKGVIIGDGSGLPELKKQCAARGVEDRILFLPRIPYAELPRYINLMDICLSTQTNDMVGQVRTTGKLPLYLACGRFVLASRVGEAARVLSAEMLVPYEGTKDEAYPGRLAERVRKLVENPDPLGHPQQISAIAKANFDYDLLAGRVRETISALRTDGPLAAAKLGPNTRGPA